MNANSFVFLAAIAMLAIVSLAERLPCEDIGCLWCGAPRVRKECKDRCHKCTGEDAVDVDSENPSSSETAAGGSTNDGGSSEKSAEQQTTEETPEPTQPQRRKTSRKTTQRPTKRTTTTETPTEEPTESPTDPPSEEPAVTDAPAKPKDNSDKKGRDDGSNKRGSNPGSGGKSPEKSSSEKGNDNSGDPFEPKLSLEDANRRFKHCCQKLDGLPQACVSVCKYDVTGSELQSAFIGGSCGLDRMSQYLYCANDDNDNIPCCKAKGVLDGSPQCSSFCGTDPPKQLGTEHFACGGKLQKIMKCHWAGLR